MGDRGGNFQPRNINTGVDDEVKSAIATPTRSHRQRLDIGVVDTRGDHDGDATAARRHQPEAHHAVCTPA